MRFSTFSAAMALAIAGLSGCNQAPSAPAPAVVSAPSIDQANLCEVANWQHDEVAAQCKPGQKIVFLPRSFGNQQLPIIFAAVNCDLRYGVALTEGAVTCIYGPITPKPAQPEQSASEAKTPAK